MAPCRFPFGLNEHAVIASPYEANREEVSLNLSLVGCGRFSIADAPQDGTRESWFLRGQEVEQAHMNESELLTYEQAARRLALKRGTLYALVSARRIPHVRMSSRIVRFKASDLDAWVASHQVSGGAARVV